MHDETVLLQVKNLSKKFARSLKYSMFYGILDVLRAIFGIKTNNEKLRKTEFWAVNQVSFELRRGQILGILGLNGSGKTSLTRLITGIYPQDKGEVKKRGRIAPLFALTAGMNPLFSGRENIFIRGTMLGMSRAELTDKLDKIIEFAELQEFIDSPLGMYSTGMRARLGFSVIVFSNPTVLIIDEGLAVGDVKFREKSFRKLREMAKEIGIIIISHSISRISQIANSIMVMHRGKIVYESPRLIDGIEYYLEQCGISQRVKQAETAPEQEFKTYIDRFQAPEINEFANRKKIHNNLKIISLHIPKTAGTSFRNILLDVYGKNQLARFDINRSRNAIEINQEKLIGELPENLAVLHGHFHYQDLIKKFILPPDLKLITWLRHPVKRVISNYLYLEKTLHKLVIPERHDLLIKMQKSLLEYASMEINRNRMSKHLRTVRLSELYFVGIVEHFSEDLQELAEELGWENYTEFQHNSTKTSENQFSKELIKRIEELNADDIQLYHTALELRKMRRTYRNQLKIISLHIPKTAGTSFNETLKEMYGTEKISYFTRERVKACQKARKNIVEDIPPETLILNGHLHYHEIQDIHRKQNLPIITWFREPVERVISNYSFFIRRLNEPPKTEAHRRNQHRKNETLLEYARMSENRNVMSRFLEGIKLEDLYFFGFLETFDEDLKRLSKLLNWTREIKPIYMNDNRDYKRKYVSITPEIRTELEKLNHADIQLYKHALQLKKAYINGEKIRDTDSRIL